MRNQQAEKC